MAAQSPIVLGNVPGRLTPSPGAELSVVDWGLDTIERPFVCLTADFNRLVPAKQSPDAEFPMMYLTSYGERRIEGLLSESKLLYVGLKSGGFPIPLVTRSREDRSASIERSVTNTSFGTRTQQYDVLYQTPVVSIRYLTFGPETTYQTTIDFPVILISTWNTVTGAAPNPATPIRGSGPPPSANWTLFNDGGVKVPVPGTPFFEVNIVFYWMLQ